MTKVRLADDLRRRGWRLYADARTRAGRRGAAASALGVLGDPDRRQLSEWNRQLAERHARYRAAFRPASERAAVICVSRRPRMLDQIVANVARQRDVTVDFVLVTNDAGYAALDVAAAISAVPGARHVDTDAAWSLGACLNVGLETTGERFVAKFDDDDHYGPDYLADSLRAHSYAGAAVVGKHTYYAEMVESGRRDLRFPGHEFAYSGTLAGGTLVIDRERTNSLQFPDISLGEDRAFLTGCHRLGQSTFSADRFNFLQRRGLDNTWSIADEEFLDGAEMVCGHDHVHAIDR